MNKDHRWFYERVFQAVEIAALIAAAATGVVAIIVGNDDSAKARRIMQDQLNSFERESRIRLRAYISIAASRTPLEVGRPLTAIVRVHAGGQTPATNVRGRGNTGDRTFPFRRDEFVIELPSEEANAISLNPGDEITLPSTSSPIDQRAFDALRQGDTRRFYMWGRVYYRDVFSCQRWQNYCFSVDDTNGSNPPDVAPCPEYNDAEGEPGECPK